MPTPDQVEYEAIGFEVFAAAPFALLAIEIATSQGTRLSVHMRRSTFDDLAARVAEAHAVLEKRAPHK